MTTNRVLFVALFVVGVGLLPAQDYIWGAGGSRELSREELAAAAKGKEENCKFYLLTNYCKDQGTTTCGTKDEKKCKGGCTGCQVNTNVFVTTLPTTDRCLTENIFGLNISGCKVHKMPFGDECGVKFRNPKCEWSEAKDGSPAQCSCFSDKKTKEGCPRYFSSGPHPTACVAVPPPLKPVVPGPPPPPPAPPPPLNP